MCDDSSSSSSSDSDSDDMDLLFFDAAFAESQPLGKRLHIDDVSETQCEQMFR